jgi:hypothetical protein
MQITKKKSFELVQLATLLAGCVLLLLGHWFLQDWKEILYSVGTAFLASSLMAVFSQRYLIDEKPDLSVKWGLVNIYSQRFEKNEKLNEKIQNQAKNVDVITQEGLATLRQKLGPRLKERLGNGLKMRILIPKIKKGAFPVVEQKLRDLVKWREQLIHKQKENIKIRYYSGVPQDLYFCVDNTIIVGPYFLNRTINQLTITYEFNAETTGGKIYSEYFDELWEKSKEGEIK